MYNFTGPGSQYIHKINAATFEDIALELFQHQYRNNDIYREFTNALHIAPAAVQSMTQIPFLPVSFFRTHAVLSTDTQPELYFESSGTTGAQNSRHWIADTTLYEASLLQGFQECYGSPADYAMLALLPSYLERKNASLVHMARTLMRESGHPSNGFYLNEWEALSNTLKALQASGRPVLLLGVTFALLDFAAAYPMSLGNTIVMETGGMKGRREEWTREQVHQFLKQQWQLPAIHSEYGMTEMLSQAYATKDGIFKPSSTMRVITRDINDPLEVRQHGSGAINIIDLANVHSCAFIATEDLGSIHEDGSFRVLGRMDHTALRGCSLMAV